MFWQRRGDKAARVGLRMIDLTPLKFLESRATVFDFAVVLAVIGIALTIGLIAASAADPGQSCASPRRLSGSSTVFRCSCKSCADARRACQ